MVSVMAPVTSKAPPPSVSGPAPTAVALPSRNTPAPKETPPGSVLAVLRTSVPKPALVRTAPAAPVIAPLIVAVESGVATVMVLEAFKFITPLKVMSFVEFGPPREKFPRASTGTGVVNAVAPNTAPPLMVKGEVAVSTVDAARVAL